MKILHTSDWHLGQVFFNKSRRQEHQAFMEWLLQLVSVQQIDAVIIAGDVFDTGAPPSYAREMYYQFVVELKQLDCMLVVLGGNHDSVSVLNESRAVLSCLNTQVVASAGVAPDEQVITLLSRSGQAGAILCAVPYIRPKDVLKSRAGETADGKNQALSHGISAHYRRVLAEAMEVKKAMKVDLPIVVTGHLAVVGASMTESVRDIYIGTLNGFSVNGLPDADYIALGHIHKPQKVAGRDHVRYSGSPIPLSFDEIEGQKQVVIVAFDDAQRRTIHTVDVPVFQPMKVIRGPLTALENTLDNMALPVQAPPVWLCVEIDSQDYRPDLQQRVQQITGDYNVEVLQIRRRKSTVLAPLAKAHLETLSELKPDEVFERRLQLEDFSGEGDQKRVERLRHRFNTIWLETMQAQKASPQMEENAVQGTLSKAEQGAMQEESVE